MCTAIFFRARPCEMGVTFFLVFIGGRTSGFTPQPPQTVLTRFIVRIYRAGATPAISRNDSRNPRKTRRVALASRIKPISYLKAHAADVIARLRDLDVPAVPHGFRSSFRDWAAECTDAPREVAEAALAHKVRNQIEAAYARSDLFDRRRKLMDDWAAYLGGPSNE